LRHTQEDEDRKEVNTIVQGQQFKPFAIYDFAPSRSINGMLILELPRWDASFFVCLTIKSFGQNKSPIGRLFSPNFGA